ncbi:DNA-directed RNA polymerases II, IV and V subunit 9A, partial [Ananas comosus]
CSAQTNSAHKNVVAEAEAEAEAEEESAMSILKFCRECNNILYPKEDKETRTLLYACRNCDHQEVADDNIVYKMEIRRPVRKGTEILHDAAADASLPRTRSVKCANCNHPEAAFFQATAKGEEGMTLFFMCCNPSCGHRWRD